MTRHRKTVAEQITALKEREEQTKARLSALMARQKAVDRKRDTRRKIVLGGAVQAHAERNPAFAAALRAALREAVTRDIDKALLADWLGDAPPPAPKPAPPPEASPGLIGGLFKRAKTAQT